MDEAVARRERLRALREAAEQAEGGEGAAAEAAAPQTEDTGPVLKFRNYNVKDESIAHEKVAPAQPPKLEEPEVENVVEVQNQEELLANIASKKANWDLKRDITPKLEKLERRTLKAIYELIQEEQAQQLREDGAAD